jgi:hypothetical protein
MWRFGLKSLLSVSSPAIKNIALWMSYLPETDPIAARAGRRSLAIILRLLRSRLVQVGGDSLSVRRIVGSRRALESGG